MVKTQRPKILSLPYPYTNQNTQPHRISQPLLLGFQAPKLLEKMQRELPLSSLLASCYCNAQGDDILAEEMALLNCNKASTL